VVPAFNPVPAGACSSCRSSRAAPWARSLSCNCPTLDANASGTRSTPVSPRRAQGFGEGDDDAPLAHGRNRVDAQLVLVAGSGFQQARVHAPAAYVFKDFLALGLGHGHRVAQAAVHIQRKAGHDLALLQRELQFALKHTWLGLKRRSSTLVRAWSPKTSTSTDAARSWMGWPALLFTAMVGGRQSGGGMNLAPGGGCSTGLSASACRLKQTAVAAWRMRIKVRAVPVWPCGMKTPFVVGDAP
jgi:hypothetical protein